MTKRTTAAALVTTGCLAGAMLSMGSGHAAPGDWKLRTKVVPPDSHCTIPAPERRWRALGPADLDRPSTDVTYRKFTNAVGTPDRVKSAGGSAVRAIYTGDHAGRFTFLNFGGEDRRAKQRLQYGSLTGESWVTENGIRVGSRLTKIKDRYGDQAWKVTDHPGRKGRWWRLAGYCGYPLVDGPVNIIEARVKRGRVISFFVWIGGAGD